MKQRVLPFIITFILFSAPPALFAKEERQKIQIHGFITQGFFYSDLIDLGQTGPNATELMLGLDDGGSFDFRTLALQFGYELNPKISIVVQLSHQAAGTNPINQREDEILPDWAIVRYQLSDNTSLKVGRILIPFGIFNELKDVGTVLPFYRESNAFYATKSFSTETIDGVSLSHQLSLWDTADLTIDIYGGEFDLYEQEITDPSSVARVRAKGGGFATWIDTPVSGLRVGFGGQIYETMETNEDAPFILPGESNDWWSYYLSLDYVTDPWVFRLEAKRQRFDANLQTSRQGLPSPPFPAEIRSVATFKPWYLQVGYRFNEKAALFAQYEYFGGTREGEFFSTQGQVDIFEDLGLAFNYSFHSSLVLKVEAHQTDGSLLVPNPAPFPNGLGLKVSETPSIEKGYYWGVSLSTSF